VTIEIWRTNRDVSPGSFVVIHAAFSPRIRARVGACAETLKGIAEPLIIDETTMVSVEPNDAAVKPRGPTRVMAPSEDQI